MHIDNLAAQTGASLFLHEFAPPRSGLPQTDCEVIYNKTEKLSNIKQYSDFDWVITEQPELFTTGSGKNDWDFQQVVHGLQKMQLISPGDQGIWKLLKMPKVVKQPTLWVFRHRNRNV